MMAKKRSLLPIQPTYVSQNRLDNWNPNVWNWDNSRFVATRMESDTLQLGTSATVVQSEPQSIRKEEEYRVSVASKAGEDDESLRLMLGGTGSMICAAPVARPVKRVRSGSPGRASYPMCQVDDCRQDLSNAKDYHRRHKVCQVHSKATMALVAKQMQRFCQQCSRFHPLSEFDEGKRSCKRRLAGHNRRRRKTQPEDITALQVLPPANREKTGNGDMDIVNLLAALARSQGSPDKSMTNFSAVSDNEQLMHILNELNSSPSPANIIEKSPILGSLDKNISNKVSSQAPSSMDVDTSSPPTKNLLAMLSTTPATNAHQFQSQRSDSHDLHNGRARGFPFVGERSSLSNQSPVQNSDSRSNEHYPNFSLQLYNSSPEIDSIPRLAADKKYFSSGSSNPSPSSSPLVAQKLFPVPTSREILKPGSISSSAKGDANVVATRATGCVMPLQLFGGSRIGAENGSSQSSLYQAGCTSSSGSDHSPSSLISDAQDRTGRIVFKLFDKDPSHLPETLRTQIYNWLSNSPSDMESYIKPGCIVLSVYVSMSSSAWDQIEEHLYQHVRSLVIDTLYSDFWRNARFLIQTHKQLASHKEGKVRVCKSWRVWGSPELISVSPVAVVFGRETSLSLRGRNLTLPGTKISCTHTDGYTIHQVPGPAYQQTTYDEISLGSFRVSNGACSTGLGRCFIEVENGVRGTSFPVIIASTSICEELKLIETEIKESRKVHDAITTNHVQESSPPSSKEEILHFLNELGWLFQRKNNSETSSDYKLGRFKFLFLFSIEHDLCALVKTLLDILTEMNIASKELEAKESLEMLSEIHLLNRAVKRRCRNMVNLLLNYSVVDSSSDTSSKFYVFPPNLIGPGGISPLHLAASMSNADDLVDALTSDPQQIGLHCWDSLLDSNRLSPYAYALMRNSHSYNTLVAQKLADKENGQICVSIGNGIESLELEKDENASSVKPKGDGSCSKCTIVAAKYSSRRMVRVPGSQGLLQRSYIHSVLAIAAVCVCVCLLFRGAPDIGSIAPFMWEKLDFGPV